MIKKNKMIKYTRKQIQDTLINKGYKYFTVWKYDVNIVGIRNSNTENDVTNKFDDIITLSYKNENNKWQYHQYKGTTDPGKYWAENIMNSDGVAILKPGQYRGSHQVALHQSKYQALCQRKPLKVYRDDNRDDHYNLNENTVQEGIFGINIHKAGRFKHGSTQIDKWSAGCQVFSKESDFNKFMILINKAKDIWGNSFTYTLIDSKDIC